MRHLRTDLHEYAEGPVYPGKRYYQRTHYAGNSAVGEKLYLAMRHSPCSFWKEESS
ncbi:hypothetical protein ACPOL_7087 (plasmid) [Acidisarcina polymorpha]|uniref:Uncharacterized protein n=1 Tax=Acidisarcina polymorpha TaxID=2211140 RepID=A0A2Z5GBA6_9BACT|nr:hypothetical protein ACPOL_7087 [Acidisarcina polymorpha]